MTDTLSGSPTRARARARRRRTLKPFVAIDGEACDVGGVHTYVLLQSSAGHELYSRDGIATRDALAWLIRVAKETSGILVGFGFNYDANMILRDVQADELAELWKAGQSSIELDSTRWGKRTFDLRWIPSKMFNVYTDGGAAEVYDTFGFFQTSFVNALDAWKIAAPEIIARLKAERGSFTLDQLDEIRLYNAEECRLLVELMDAVRDALRDVGLVPRHWLGAGSIASALLAKHAVDQHVATKRPHTLDEDVLLRAYFGGRTEVFRQGLWQERAFAWDVNSAYPAEAIELPTAHGRWRRSRSYEPSEPWAIWRVRWRLPNDDEILCPFPFRDRRSIYYPLEGEGWFHAPEIAAAIELYGDAIEVTSGYVFTPADDTRPFAFLHDVYAERQELKRQGHAGEKVLKLGINSVYGKLAQGNARDGKRPRFQDYFWSGRITSGTRAKVLRAAASNRDALVAIATDGILFAGGEPELEPGVGLGAWERTVYRSLFVAQPGIYYAHRTGGATVKHSRGFFVREINFPKLVRQWREHGPFGELDCPSTRFVGIGTALHRNRLDLWRTWTSSTRRLSLYSARKFYDTDDDGELVRSLLPPSQVRPGLSDRYVPKHDTLGPADEEYVQGLEQPMRVF